MARISPMDVYKLLPGENTQKCGEASCMAFASKLIDRQKRVEDCPLFEEEKYHGKKEELIKLLSPPVKEVVIGTGERSVKIGGEEVLYRHELTYFNQTAFAIDVHDEMTEEEIAERVEQISEFTIERVGQQLSYDAVAIRSKSGDATKFGSAVLAAVEKTSMPLILCSYEPELLEVGLEIALEKRPLIYAATKENWHAVAELALKHGCPVVASSPGDIEGLIHLTSDLMDTGIEDIVLDVGTNPLGNGFGETLDNLVMLRRSAIDKNIEELRFPILGVSMVAWTQENDQIAGSYKEASIAASQLARFCDILIMHSLDIWATLPLLTLRQNIYTDPRTPIKVEPGLHEMGSPDEKSPVFLTTNFALTYYTVTGDLESAKIPCHLLVADTEGLAVVCAIAGGKLVSSTVKEVIDSSGIEKKVKHKKLVIPGTAARISGDIEDATGWKVLIGPMDSSRIPGFLEKHWG